MATDIFQLLIDIFKISPQMVNQYATVSPLEQIFYLFFFPTLFIIVLIFILTRYITEHKGINLMIALAVYAFIIFQGLYNWFVFLSKYWLLGLILLAFIYLILGKLGQPRGAKGMTAAQGKGGAAGGLFDDVKKRLKGQITGEFKDRERMIKSMLDQIDKAQKMAGGNPQDLDNILGGGGGAMIMMARINQLILDLRRDGSIMGFPESRIKKLIDQYNDVAQKLGAKTIAKK